MGRGAADLRRRAGAALPRPGRLRHARRGLPLGLPRARLLRRAAPARLGRHQPDRPPRRDNHVARQPRALAGGVHGRADRAPAWADHRLPGAAAAAGRGGEQPGGRAGLPAAAPARPARRRAAGRAAVGHRAVPDRVRPAAACRRAGHVVLDAERAAAAYRHSGRTANDDTRRRTLAVGRWPLVVSVVAADRLGRVRRAGPGEQVVVAGAAAVGRGGGAGRGRGGSPPARRAG